MNKQFIRDHKIAITFLSILLVVVIILFLLILSITSNPNSAVLEKTGTTEELPWKSYLYDDDYIISGFKISYPSWDEVVSEASGSWDISLTDVDSKIFIDLSGQGNSSFEQSLSDWITNWGSQNISYTFEVLDNGTLSENRGFVIYKVSESGKTPYVLAIVDVAKMYEGRAHLAIKATKESDLSYVEEIITSIETISD